MLEIKIIITAADLAASINNLAAALSGSKALPDDKMPVASPAQPAPLTTVNAETIPIAATPAHRSESAAETTPASAAPIVPTAAPQYTLEMLATAGSALIDEGKMEQLKQLLAKFGVASLTELRKENYGAVASELRAIGARI